MVRFAEGELALPIRSILWAPSNSAHFNHLHVEGPHVSGTLASCTSKWTEAITEIRGALDGRFGEGDHYQVWDDSLGWTHMGVYNCRNIANTNTPSQHAFSNAIDIGPYYGVEEQQKFYDFLTRKKGEDDDMPSPKDWTAEDWKAVRDNTAGNAWGRDGYVIPDPVSGNAVHPNTMLRAIRTQINNILGLVKNIDASDGATAEEIADELAARLAE